MNNFETHDAATDLAAGRTAYSLAREVLGLRAQAAELREELEETAAHLKRYMGFAEALGRAEGAGGYQPRPEGRPIKCPPKAK